MKCKYSEFLHTYSYFIQLSVRFLTKYCTFHISSKSLRKGSEKSSARGTSSVWSVSLEQEAQLQTDFF
jgi:hypothetical protein